MNPLLSYINQEPQGFPVDSQEYRIQGTIQGEGPLQNIMFQLTQQNSDPFVFLNPHKTRIEFTLKIDGEIPDYAILSLDQSAGSLYDQIKISSKNQDVEHLENVDLIANILNELSYNDQLQEQKPYEGYGGNANTYSQHQGMVCQMNQQVQSTDLQEDFPSSAFVEIDNNQNLHSCKNIKLPMQQFQNLNILNEKIGYTQAFFGIQQNRLQPIQTYSPLSFSYVNMQQNNQQLGSYGYNVNQWDHPLLGQVFPNKLSDYNTLGGRFNYTQDLESVHDRLFFHHREAPTYDGDKSVSGYILNYQSNFRNRTQYFCSNNLGGAFTGDYSDYSSVNIDGDSLTKLQRQEVDKLQTLVGSQTTNISESSQYNPCHFNDFTRGRNQIQKQMDQFTGLNMSRFEYHQGQNYNDTFEPIDDNSQQISKDFRVIKHPTYHDKQYLKDFEYTGYRNPFNQKFCRNNFEPFMCGNGIQLKVLKEGIPQNQMGKQSMFISAPLYSHFFGCLMTSQNFKYMPMFLFPDLQIIIRTNQYSLYSSGYVASGKIYQEGVPFNQYLYRQNQNLFDANGDVNAPQFKQKTQIQRKFKIISAVLVYEGIKFDSNITSQITSGMAVNSAVFKADFWSTCVDKQIDDIVKINMAEIKLTKQYQKLKKIFIGLYPRDYAKYAFCRKNFRISGCVTKLQLKVNYTKQIPKIKPLQGLSSTPFGSLSDDGYNPTNKEFYNELMDACGKLYNLHTSGLINPWNYSVIDRCYDPSRLGTAYSNYEFDMDVTAQQANEKGHQLNQLVEWVKWDVQPTIPQASEQQFMMGHNQHTACGLPYFNENRVIGRCLFAINCSSNIQGQQTEDLYTIGCQNTCLYFEINTQIKNFTRPLEIKALALSTALLIVNPEGQISRQGIIG